MSNFDDMMNHPIFVRPDVGDTDTLEAVISWIYDDINDYIEETSLERWQWRLSTPPNVLAYTYFDECRHLEAQFKLRAAFPHLDAGHAEDALTAGVLCWFLKQVEDDTRLDELVERLTRASVSRITYDVPTTIARWWLIQDFAENLELTMACCEAHLCV